MLGRTEFNVCHTENLLILLKRDLEASIATEQRLGSFHCRRMTKYIFMDNSDKRAKVLGSIGSVVTILYTGVSP